MCPEFEIRQWDETNFPIDDYPYARQAYDAGTIRRADRGHNYTIHHYDGSWLLCNTPEYVALRRRYKPIPYFIRKKLILAKLGINTRGFFPTLLRLKRWVFGKNFVSL